MTDKPCHSMKGPKVGRDLSERILDCEFDLEPTFVGLMEEAVALGWTRAEVAIALTTFADNYLLSRISMAQTSEKINRVVAKLGKSEH